MQKLILCIIIELLIGFTPINEDLAEYILIIYELM